MNNSYEIEYAKRSDIEEIIRLVHLVVNVSLKDVYPESVRKWFHDYHSVEYLTQEFDDGAHVFIVKDESKIVATATYYQTELKRVFIDPKYQKLGLGRRLMDKMEQIAQKLGDDITVLYANPRSWKYYESLGYATTLIAAHTMDNGDLFCYIKMIKQFDKNPYSVKEDNISSIINTLSSDAISYFGGKDKLSSYNYKDICCASATSNGKTIGIALGKKLDCDTASILDVWVEPEHRRRYVGDSLVHVIEDKFSKAKKYVTQVDDNNKLSKEFFVMREYRENEGYKKMNVLDLAQSV